jgi:hypothetical protein
MSLYAVYNSGVLGTKNSRIGGPCLHTAVHKMLNVLTPLNQLALLAVFLHISCDPAIQYSGGFTMRLYVVLVCT